ncbi:MAG: hypothetical protein Fur0014_22130 [Rubrivivax sp.]
MAPATFASEPVEVPATANKRLLDPEFNREKGLFTWVDIIDGSIWVSQIDKATGNFIPADGRWQLVERSAAPIGGLGFSLNGPEWVLGAQQDYIVYTRYDSTSPQSPELARLGAAVLNSKGQWVRRTISAELPRNSPFGSENPTDVAPRITYNDEAGNHYWRVINDPSTEELLPGLVGTGLLPAVRHVRDSARQAVTYPLTVDGVPQVHWYDTKTKVFEQITFDAGTKEQPWIWRAPDFDNGLVMLTTVDTNTLAFYVKGRDGGASGSSWERRLTIPVPEEGGRFFSTEPFVYDGKSYVIMMIIVGNYPRSIWLANFDSSAPILRRLTPTLPDRARADPEVFFTDNGPVVFFSRFDQTKGSYWLCVRCAEGLYRVETGIPPAARR